MKIKSHQMSEDERRFLKNLASKYDTPDWKQIARNMQEKFHPKKWPQKILEEIWNGYRKKGKKKEWTESTSRAVFEQGYRRFKTNWNEYTNIQCLKDKKINEIKNHFYSHIRYQLRHLDKLVFNDKKSSERIKKIKAEHLKLFLDGPEEVNIQNREGSRQLLKKIITSFDEPQQKDLVVDLSNFQQLIMTDINGSQNKGEIENTESHLPHQSSSFQQFFSQIQELDIDPLSLPFLKLEDQEMEDENLNERIPQHESIHDIQEEIRSDWFGESPMHPNLFSSNFEQAFFSKKMPI